MIKVQRWKDWKGRVEIGGILDRLGTEGIL